MLNLNHSSPEEEHDGAGVVQLVHLVKFRRLCDVYEVDVAKVLALFGDGKQGLVHLHARRVPVVAETDYNNLNRENRG
jgi:hypothetical protein